MWLCKALKLHIPTRESGDVHLGEVPGLEDDHGEPGGRRLVAEGHQQLPTTLDRLP